ncbi:beta-galactosidase [Paenibacillus sp. N4]|uniref:alpha-amylase family protein n=1 Tax=Paenibacillus vietnamensis TaxID=2590547 RepID=UPI001CD0B510|nr:alpha-amylase family protein [Paenibacillus vietnamensis]MCA0753610.1 beta-galactosidase [Paenibacillus vietnamensis]
MSKLIIFYDPSFPIGGKPILVTAEELAGAGVVVQAAGLAEALRDCTAGDVFVNLHAPYFPKEAWTDILSFLKRGGGLISAGGAPFKRPVRFEDGAWQAEAEQTAYHRELLIHETLPVDGTPVGHLSASAEIPLLEGREALFEAGGTWNLVPHVSKSSDLPHQMGSAGPMDAHLYPLVKGISDSGREVAAPVLLWENTKGAFAGGRWLFINQPITEAFWSRGGAAEIGRLAAYCAAGVTELWLKPGYASYEAGERALLTLQAQRLGRDTAKRVGWSFAISVTKDGEPNAGWSTEASLEADSQLEIVRFPVDLELTAGFYRVECRAVSADGELRLLRQGFWGFDAKLLAEGSPVACERDYFVKDGRPLPVVGMTYMTSDVARKFLFLPNAAVWDRDMAQMRKAGINWIRTGIWTAYRNIMQVDGHASEEVLRSIDAFLLTAKKHDLQVTFTFFSFTPEPWEGLNPYLDPRSVEAQKRFVRSIVSRHRTSTHVDWDLINEPSMFDPPRIFSDGPRSCRDPFERAAFAAWLEKRHGSIMELQAKWNMTPEQLPDFGAAVPPEPEEINFDVQDMHQGKKGTRWLDYALFSMDMHNEWAKQLTEAIKDINPDQLVAVGQDEALGAQRPSPFFYEQASDYTTVHSWWLNDHLVWDGIFAKTPFKPNLIQETGIMYVETPEGRAKRSESELRSMLERKYAYAFSTGGAGAVQWIWNTNFYMDNANESHIGALRADGTEKPEADVSYDFGRFMEQIRDLFAGRELEDTVVVFPYSNDFSNRKLAFDATTKATRVLAYELNQPFRGIGEYQLDALKEQPAKLIILPSAHNVDNQAFEKLMAAVREDGATLLVTGPLGLDEYWRTTARLENELGTSDIRNVCREEALKLEGKLLPLSFGARRIAEVSKEVRTMQGGVSGAAGDAVVDMPLGKGRLIWSPLPVELNERTGSIAALYNYALAAADCRSELEWLQGGELPGVYGRKLTFEGGSLFVFVSEYGMDAEVKVKDRTTGQAYSFLLEKERSVLFAADPLGNVYAVYRDGQVKIDILGQS